MEYSINKFAEIVGVHRETVMEWKRKGMPHRIEDGNGKRGRPKIIVDDVQATAWIAANTERGRISVKAAGNGIINQLPPIDVQPQKPATASAPLAPIVPPAAQSPSGMAEFDKKIKDPVFMGKLMSEATPEVTMEQLNLAQIFAFRLYMQAIKSDDITLQTARLRILNDIVKAKNDVNDNEAEAEKYRSELAGEMREQWHKWAEPVRSILDSMPKTIAPRCNPTDPAMAEKVVYEYIQHTLLPIMCSIPEDKTSDKD